MASYPDSPPDSSLLLTCGKGSANVLSSGSPQAGPHSLSDRDPPQWDQWTKWEEQCELPSQVSNGFAEQAYFCIWL